MLTYKYYLNIYPFHHKYTSPEATRNYLFKDLEVAKCERMRTAKYAYGR